MAWRKEYEKKKSSVESLASLMYPGSCVYVESGCGEPQHIAKGLIFDNDRLCDVQVFTSIPLSAYTDFGGDFGSRFRLHSFFISPSMTTAYDEGHADHLPLSTTGMYKLFTEGYIKVNVALIQLSPPDSKGYMSLGVSVDISRSIIEHAGLVIAQVNHRMPMSRGDTMVHVSEVDHIVEFDEPLVSFSHEEPDPETLAVGKNVARLVEDGSTIQIGFGRIPDAALVHLKDRKDLRIHSEIITDTVVDLAASGALENGRSDPAKPRITASMCIGSRRVFDFVNDNKLVELRDIIHVTNPYSVLAHDRFVSINGAMEIDLTGQSCVGTGEQMTYFGALGHAFFNRTAMFSPGGKGIIALRSTSRDGKHSRIVPGFSGNRIGIVTTQSDINYVVTEYGSVDLFGKSIRERALALISIAHPSFRQWLLDEAKRMKFVYPDQILPSEDHNRFSLAYEHGHEFGGREVFIRPIRVTDERSIQNLFYSMSKDDRFQRFLMHVNALHHKQAQNLVSVDYRDSIAMVVEGGSEKLAHIIAVAHIANEENVEGRKVCEFAVMVDPAWQNKGIGTYMLKCMMNIGRDFGFKRMRAYIWEDNGQMLKAFEKTGCGMTQELDSHVYQVNLDI
jgi:acyl-CoA hydrolase/RimJ/RimL family protein N-acetyltransferase